MGTHEKSPEGSDANDAAESETRPMTSRQRFRSMVTSRDLGAFTIGHAERIFVLRCLSVVVQRLVQAACGNLENPLLCRPIMRKLIVLGRISKTLKPRGVSCEAMILPPVMANGCPHCVPHRCYFRPTGVLRRLEICKRS